MNTIYTLLRAACERPGMFDAEASLRPLQDMCHGYSVALQNHGIDEPGVNFNRRFGDFLFRRFGWSTSCGWADAIGSNVRPGATPIATLKSLLNEFEAGDA